jgi:cytochrome P450
MFRYSERGRGEAAMQEARASELGQFIPADITATLIDPRAYADHRIHDAYRWLRANNPLGYAAPAGYDPFWVVTKHADLLDVSRQNALFCSSQRAVNLTTQAADKRIRDINGGNPNVFNMLVNMDGPQHSKYRALSQAWFMPHNLRKLEDGLRAIARQSVEKMLASGGRCDFVRDVALGYPLRVVMNILGVPEEDEPRMLMLTQQVFGPEDPDMARQEGDAQDPARWADQLRAIYADFNDYFARISADRRVNPRDDLATVIANAQIDGAPIPEHEALSYYVIVATAGHDTTSSSTAGLLLALCENPSEFAKVKADLSLIPGFIEEAIRWTTPVKHFMRCATADTALRGRKIAKGDLLMLCYASGNRDEEIFEDPFVFRSDRKPNKQLAFGYGAHSCLGQHLARLEMKILFQELLPRLKSVSLDGTPTFTQATLVNGPKSLPVKFETV